MLTDKYDGFPKFEAVSPYQGENTDSTQSYFQGVQLMTELGEYNHMETSSPILNLDTSPIKTTDEVEQMSSNQDTSTTYNTAHADNYENYTDDEKEISPNYNTEVPQMEHEEIILQKMKNNELDVIQMERENINSNNRKRYEKLTRIINAATTAQEFLLQY